MVVTQSESGGGAQEADEYLMTARMNPAVLNRLRTGLDVRQLTGEGADFEIEEPSDDEAAVDEPLQVDEDYLDELSSHFSSIHTNAGDGTGKSLSFEQLKRIMTDVSPPTTEEPILFKRTLKEGNTELPRPRGGLYCIHYSLYYEDQDEPFDSTKQRARPHQFRFGDGTTLEGIQGACETMCVGERAQFLMHPVIMHKQHGIGKIRGNAWVLADIVVVELTATDAADALEQMSSEQRIRNDFKINLKASKQEREIGALREKSGKFSDALNHFRRGSVYIEENTNVFDEADDELRQRHLCVLRNDIARCLLKMGRYRQVQKETAITLQMFPYDPHANLFRGKSFKKEERFTQALACIQKGLVGRPGSVDLNKELKEITEKIAGSKEDEMEYAARMGKMFGGSGEVRTDKKKSEAPRFTRLVPPEEREAIVNKMQLVVEEKKPRVVFPAFDMSKEAYDFVKALAEDHGLTCKDDGAGLDSTLVISRPTPAP